MKGAPNLMLNGIQVVIEITRDVYWVPFIKHSVFSLHVSQIRVVIGVCEITADKYCSSCQWNKLSYQHIAKEGSFPAEVSFCRF